MAEDGGGQGNPLLIKKQTTAWNKAANRKRQTIQWRFTKTKARKSMGYKHDLYGKTFLPDY